MRNPNMSEELGLEWSDEHGIWVHVAHKCGSEWCCIHNPSDHNMRDFPLHFRMDRGALAERICPHGIGHPDPDSVAFFVKMDPSCASWIEVHGCDGCCFDREDEE